MKIELLNSPSCLGAVFLINAYICNITYLCIYFMMQSVGLRGLTLEQKWLSLLDLVGQFQIHKKKTYNFPTSIGHNNCQNEHKLEPHHEK